MLTELPKFLDLESNNIYEFTNDSSKEIGWRVRTILEDLTRILEEFGLKKSIETSRWNFGLVERRRRPNEGFGTGKKDSRRREDDCKTLRFFEILLLQQESKKLKNWDILVWKI